MKSILFGIFSTLLIGSVTAIALKIFTPTIFFPLNFFRGPWAILTVLLIVPGVITTIGLALRKMWSLPLATFLSFAVILITGRDIVLNFEDYLKYSNFDLIFLVIVGLLFLFTFLMLSFSRGVKQYFNFNNGIKGLFTYLYKHKFLFSLCLVGFILLQSIIVNRYTYYQQFPWPPPEIANKEIHKKWPFFVRGNIKNEDITLIIAEVAKLDDIDKEILYVIENDDNSVLVITGELVAPLWGSGNEIVLKKENNEWVVVDQGYWVS